MERSHWQELADSFLASYPPGPYNDRLLEALIGSLPRELTEEELARFRRCDPVDQRELARLLADRRARHVVKMIVYAARCVPEGLLEAMIRSGVETIDPSYNKQFIWPCLVSHGRRRVLTILQGIARNGTDFEKAGAANARYWATEIPSVPYYWPDDSSDAPSTRRDDSIGDLHAEWTEWVLGEFVRNPNVEVLRSLIYWLPETYEPDPKALEEALRIAAANHDGYIRHRLQVQMGQSVMLQPLPHRAAPPDSVD